MDGFIQEEQRHTRKRMTRDVYPVRLLEVSDGVIVQIHELTRPGNDDGQGAQVTVSNSERLEIYRSRLNHGKQFGKGNWRGRRESSECDMWAEVWV